MIKGKKVIGIALLLSLFLLVAACGKKEDKQDASGTVNLTWYMTGIPQKDIDKVNDAVNDYTKEKYNLTVTLNQIDWGEYDQKMSALVNAGETFDLAFTASWLGGFNYLTNARKGGFLDITEYLDGDNSKLKATLDEKFWQGAEIDGQVYVVPTQKEIAATEFFVFNKELVDKYQVPYEDIKTYADLEPWLKKIKEEEDIFPWYMSEGYKNPYEFDELNTSVGINLEGDQNKITDYYFEAPYLERVKNVRKFMEAGYINENAALAKQTDIVGKDWFVTSTVMGPLDTATVEDQVKKEVVVTQMTDSIVTNASAVGAGTVVGANSDHPEEAMKLLEAVNTDPVLMNLLAYGIEGTHYEKTGDDTIKWLDAHSNYTTPYYMFGSYFNLYHAEGAQVDEWEILKEYNATATPSPALGFNFDTTSVSTQIAALNNVQEEFKNLINTGSVDPEENLKKMETKMKAAGLDEVIKEMQSQYDKWKK
ncbi:ABC transporter substrate-binding protein [Vagococcus sp. BWB3-3]|uniref:ABC transporter substrate-binding protein n=1 Tax=Vagococcus allomyrinae TaxID=2794353 RepID=A0A940SU34_9ENTE|nr:ABC transporter substrate-binding protein [Vagococcus allomyrinae]MBP1039671.1 ABC transporter substrate-binding protein [Vagococcus allomyrinae]